MNIVEKLASYFTASPIQKLDKVIAIDTELNKIQNRANTLSEVYAEKYNENLIFKSEDDEISNAYSTRYNSYLENHVKEVNEIIKSKSALSKERETLLSNKVVSSLYNERKELQVIRKARKEGILTETQYIDILKARKKSVKFSDVIVFNEQGQILLLKRDADDETNDTWVIPGGHVDEGEECEVAARRELSEETGINNTKIEYLGERKTDTAHIKYYRTTIDTNEKFVTLMAGENKRYIWVFPHEIRFFTFPYDMKQNVMELLGVPTMEEFAKASKDKVSKVMGEFKEGTLRDSHGKKVKSKEQALAIAISEAGLSEKEGILVKALASGVINQKQYDKVKANKAKIAENKRFVGSF
jgi:mutator protein MutT